MARAKTNFMVEEALMERVRQTAERMRWSMADATELAFELFLEKFEGANILSLTTPTQLPDLAPAEPVEVTR